MDRMSRPPLSPAEINELIAGLNRLARNLWWTWNQDSQELFQELSPRGGQSPGPAIEHATRTRIPLVKPPRRCDRDSASRAERALEITPGNPGSMSTRGSAPGGSI